MTRFIHRPRRPLQLSGALPLLAALMLSACGGPSPDTTAAAPTDTIDLRVTAEVETGVNAQHITVIPNDVAPWLSHIIIISDKGSLYQTALDSGKAKPLNAKAIDAIGLMREKAAGVVLTLSDAGTVSAMIETDDTGRLGAITVSANLPPLSRFCHGDKAPRGNVHAMTAKGDILSVAILVQDAQIILSETGRMDAQNGASGCYVSRETPQFQTDKSSGAQFGVLDFGTPQSTLAVKTSGDVVWHAGKDAATIAITPGLSTPGLSKAAAIHATTDSLGGAFRDGAVIIADADTPRLVMISAGFAQQTLMPVAAATDE